MRTKALDREMRKLTYHPIAIENVNRVVKNLECFHKSTPTDKVMQVDKVIEAFLAKRMPLKKFRQWFGTFPYKSIELDFWRLDMFNGLRLAFDSYINGLVDSKRFRRRVKGIWHKYMWYKLST